MLDYDARQERADDVMITLDFSGLHEPVCKGVDSPGTEKSDFELWSPHDDGRHGSNDKCFLGQQVTYVRRKQDSECFNGEDFERQTMRVPCLCTQADYECDMNYVKNKAGNCEMVEDPTNTRANRLMTEKEEDCALEGFYYITQGYRKIPGNKCYGGVQLDPIKKPCTSMAWLTSIVSSKSLVICALLGAAMYYGWPIIEAVILVLPIPDPKDSLDRVKAAAGQASGMVQGAMGNANIGGIGGGAPAGYTNDMDSQPEAFMDDDNSDDDVGKPMNSGLAYDSDEKDEEEMGGAGGGELIDLGGGDSSTARAATHIPKLSGPN